MKKGFLYMSIVFALFLSGGSRLQAQSDPRTRKIIEAVLQTTAKEIGSTAESVPETPVKAKSYTTTEQPAETSAKSSSAASSASQASAKSQSGSGGTSQSKSRKGSSSEQKADSKKAAVAETPEPVSEPAPVSASSSGSRPYRLPQLSIDTIYLSTSFTTHLIFDTDISYADLSNQKDIAGKIVDEAKNKLALKARVPFSTTASLSVEEGSGSFHTYILKYGERPDLLIVDTRNGADLRALMKLDTVYVSTLYTTHLIFTSDVIYADISRPGDVTGRLVDQGRNKLATKARSGFSGLGSLSVEEANGIFHTYIVKYMEQPSSLVKDTREEGKPTAGSLAGTTTRGSVSGSYLKGSASRSGDGSSVSSNKLKKLDAPMLSEVIDLPQGLFHISGKKYDIRITCENIFSYSDIIYMTFRLDNNSGISYEVSDATFVLESSNGSKRKIVYEENIFPKNRFGTLTCQPKSSARICYSFDKMALSSDQLLQVYLYEQNGQRNIALPISYKDINNAVAPISVK